MMLFKNYNLFNEFCWWIVINNLLLFLGGYVWNIYVNIKRYKVFINKEIYFNEKIYLFICYCC